MTRGISTARRAALRRLLLGATPLLVPLPSWAQGTGALPRPAPASAIPAAADRLIVGADGGSLPDALARARDGDTIELLPGDYTGAPLVLEGRRLTLRGVGNRPVFKHAGRLPGGAKALLTVRGGEVTLENLRFGGARADNGEGAGLRMEGGRLTVRDCSFYDNEYGLHALNDESARLHIEHSEFGQAPKVVGGLHHLLNVGRIGSLEVRGTRFQQGFEGHLIKVRARETMLAYNFIHDGFRGGASYEVDLAGGGVATLIGNVIGQGSDTQNPVVVAYGAEGGHWERNELRLAHNTLVNYGWTPAWFLRVFEDKMRSPQVVAVNNLVVGIGVFSLGAPGRFEGNRTVSRRQLRDFETYAFELPPDSMWRNSGIDPRNIDGHDLSPKGEFDWPARVVPLEGERTSWTPGAFQR